MIDKQQASKYQSQIRLQDQAEEEEHSPIDDQEEEQANLDRMRSAEAGSVVSSNPIGPIAATLNPHEENTIDGENTNHGSVDERSNLLTKDSNGKIYNGIQPSTTQANGTSKSLPNREKKSLWCIVSDPRFVTTSFAAVLRAIIGSTWSATIPLHAKKV